MRILSDAGNTDDGNTTSGGYTLRRLLYCSTTTYSQRRRRYDCIVGLRDRRCADNGNGTGRDNRLIGLRDAGSANHRHRTRRRYRLVGLRDAGSANHRHRTRSRYRLAGLRDRRRSAHAAGRQVAGRPRRDVGVGVVAAIRHNARWPAGEAGVRRRNIQHAIEIAPDRAAINLQPQRVIRAGRNGGAGIENRLAARRDLDQVGSIAAKNHIAVIRHGARRRQPHRWPDPVAAAARPCDYLDIVVGRVHRRTYPTQFAVGVAGRAVGDIV